MDLEKYETSSTMLISIEHIIKMATKITNQEFLDTYDRLNTAKQNFIQNNKTVLWEQLVEILYNLPTEIFILPRPTNEVSKS